MIVASTRLVSATKERSASVLCGTVTPRVAQRASIWSTTSFVPRHQMVSGNLIRILYVHIAEYGLGEILPGPLDVILSRTNVLVPDACTLEAYRRFGRGYRRTARLEGNDRFHPTLFPSLEIDLAAVWA